MSMEMIGVYSNLVLMYGVNFSTYIKIHILFSINFYGDDRSILEPGLDVLGWSKSLICL